MIELLSQKNLLGIVSVVICLFQYGPLLVLTLRGKKKPHVYTRFIWALTFGIAYAAQMASHGGAGSWANGVSGLFCVAIALAAMRGSR